MKTPRELLLARHRGVVPKLDALRRAVVAEHVGATGREEPVPSRGFWESLWIELFWSCRRAWIGLAAGGAMALLLHLAMPEARSGSAPPTTTSPNWSALRAALAAQHRYRAELLGDNPRSPVGGSISGRPGPRSQRTGDLSAG